MTDATSAGQLRHRFKIDPIPPARVKMMDLQAQGLPLPPPPDHIRDAVTLGEEDDGIVRATGPFESLWFPTPLERPKWFLMARGYRDRLRAKYTLPGFVDLEEGDVVVDCGAYAAGFSLAAAPLASRVIAVEPSPRNIRCLRRNIEGTGIEVVQCGLGAAPGHFDFIDRENSTDSSFLEEDGTAETGRTRIEIVTLDGLRARMGIERIDFLKTEAEGLELEILTCAHPETVRKIAIDTTPERHDQSPFMDIAVMLANRGYRLANSNYMLFATAD